MQDKLNRKSTHTRIWLALILAITLACTLLVSAISAVVPQSAYAANPVTGSTATTILGIRVTDGQKDMNNTASNPSATTSTTASTTLGIRITDGQKDMNNTTSNPSATTSTTATTTLGIRVTDGSKVTVTWDPNGGYWGSTTTDKAAKTSSHAWDAAVTGYNGSTVPTAQTGYKFVGWSTNKNATSGSTSINVGTTNATYYAIWAKVVYTVTLNANADNGGSSVSPTKVYLWSGKGWYSDAACTGTKYTASTFPKATAATGYSFKGWYDAATAGTQKAASGILPPLTAVSANTTWYAQYDKVVYTVTLNANADNGGSSVSPTKVYLWSGKGWYSDAACTGTKYTASTFPKATAATGYSFKGWYDAATAGTQKAASGILPPLTAVSANTTWYAQYDANTYTVTFNANGGSVSPTTKTVTYDSTYEDLPTPTRAGYTFAGWYTDASGGTQVTSSTKVTITSNQTLYAHWTANTITLTWDSQGGTTVGNTTQTYSSTSSVFCPTPNPTKTGYTFDGWWTTKDTSGYKVNNNSEPLPPTNTTYYAHWTINKYSVSYVDTSGNTTSATFDYNTEITMKLEGGTAITTGWTQSGSNYTRHVTDGSIEMPTPTRIGYRFGGWALSNTTFTAQWVQQFNVTYKSGDVGTQTVAVDTGTTITMALAGGSFASAPAGWTKSGENYTMVVRANVTLPEPTRTGYTLSKWTCDSSTNTFTAEWRANTYTVNIKAGEGVQTLTANPTSYTYSENDSQSVTLTVEASTGYDITKVTWSCTNNNVRIAKGENNTYTATIPTGTTEDITITATCAKASYNYTVNYYLIDSNPLTSVKESKTESAEYGTTITLDSVKAEIDGYNFVSGTPETLTIGVDATQNVFNLYYEPNGYTYTIKYFDGDTQLTTQTVTSGAGQVTLYNEENENCKKEGYILAGWSKTKGATTAEYGAGATVGALADQEGAEVSLYAVWTLRLKCTIPTDKSLAFNIETGNSIPVSLEVKSETVVPIDFSAYALAGETGSWLFNDEANRDKAYFSFNDSGVKSALPLLYNEPSTPNYKLLVGSLGKDATKYWSLSLMSNGASWQGADAWKAEFGEPTDGTYNTGDKPLATIRWCVAPSE
ncbi:InlB B-repeat-containing protein [Adlercreutzia sp. ZJ304]|uniref:InlB B-repeat-containing protein n=1 Tax=Adlercreutzia sp. ZJ304 TaxID=2709791 RepID=UPI0013ED7C7A|nr:InlB B-repeat-containing protein [Adlercreutzia sp. ZJ304]